MDVVRERLEREYDLDLITTAPSVVYKVEKGEGEKKKTVIIDTPSKMPEILRDMTVTEPYVRMEVLTPSEYNGAIIELGQERRGILKDIKYLTPTRSVSSSAALLTVICFTQHLLQINYSIRASSGRSHYRLLRSIEVEVRGILIRLKEACWHLLTVNFLRVN